MATTRYHAMTASEFTAADPLPQNIAWMACHFSPYEPGLTNLPPILPSGSVLILNDRIPFHSHDCNLIARQLQNSVTELHPYGILLDFQSQNNALAELSSHLVAVLPCPVAVPAEYAANLNCPVFLSPCPHHIPLQNYILPWAGREIWLDLATDAESIILTEAGADCCPLAAFQENQDCHTDKALHSHYSIANEDHAVRFTLWRTASDLDDLEKEAESLGIRTLVGLYRELRLSD